MESLPVTLIVKAPNQQIEDQTVKCELSWTINKLKQHLSEVYPSKPPKHEQRLIYSGQLLGDSVVLKDILRQFDGQDTHTVHLICSTKQDFKPKQPMPSEANIAQPSTSRNAANDQVPNLTSNQSSSAPAASENGNEDPAAHAWANNVSMNQYWQGMAQLDPTQYAAQMAYMQQAYFQYMNQYMQMANSYGTNLEAPNNEAVQPPIDENRAGDNNAVPAPAQARQQRDGDNLDRDWLDHFYVISRMLVLISVVYFYSSLVRFVFVLMLGLSLYLYQIGFFRNINTNNNNNNNAAPGEAAPPPEEQVHSRLMIIWTFFTTFFASLLPEIPTV